MSGEGIRREDWAAAVTKFTQLHESRALDPSQKRYRELIPSQKPGLGQALGKQYAFEVDLDKCTGCKACVSACHNENGLDEDETWRAVGLLQGGGRRGGADAARDRRVPSLRRTGVHDRLSDESVRQGRADGDCQTSR